MQQRNTILSISDDSLDSHSTQWTKIAYSIVVAVNLSNQPCTLVVYCRRVATLNLATTHLVIVLTSLPKIKATHPVMQEPAAELSCIKVNGVLYSIKQSCA